MSQLQRSAEAAVEQAAAGCEQAVEQAAGCEQAAAWTAGCKQAAGCAGSGVQNMFRCARTNASGTVDSCHGRRRMLPRRELSTVAGGARGYWRGKNNKDPCKPPFAGRGIYVKGL